MPCSRRGAGQIDLLILHQALPSDFGKTLEAYRALERLLKDGKVRAIGVSNFMAGHLTNLRAQGVAYRSRCLTDEPDVAALAARLALSAH
jgi:diketogulonate reductase-like aldo/keto reductase